MEKENLLIPIQDGIDWINDRIDDALEWLGLEDVNINAGGGMSTDSRGNTDTWGWNPSTDERYSSGPGSVVGGNDIAFDSLDPRFYQSYENELYSDLYGGEIDFDYYINNPDYLVADASGIENDHPLVKQWKDPYFYSREQLRREVKDLNDRTMEQLSIAYDATADAATGSVYPLFQAIGMGMQFFKNTKKFSESLKINPGMNPAPLGQMGCHPSK